MRVYSAVMLGFLHGLLFGSVGELISRWMRHRSVVDTDIVWSDGSHTHLHGHHMTLNQPDAILFLASLFAAISFVVYPFWKSRRLDLRFWNIVGVVGVLVWNLLSFITGRWLNPDSADYVGPLWEALGDALVGNLSLLRGLPSLTLVLIVSLLYSGALHLLWRGRDSK